MMDVLLTCQASQPTLERSIAWTATNRVARDYEWKVQTNECRLEVAMIRHEKRLRRN